MFNGYEKWPVDKRKCTGMRVGKPRGSGCGTCLKVCPWSKPYTPFHRAVNWAMRHSGIARSLAIRGDDFLGYGKPDYNDQVVARPRRCGRRRDLEGPREQEE